MKTLQLTNAELFMLQGALKMLSNGQITPLSTCSDVEKAVYYSTSYKIQNALLEEDHDA